MENRETNVDNKTKRQRLAKKFKDIEENVYSLRPSICRYMKCRKRTARHLDDKPFDQLPVISTKRGSFAPLPLEVILRILSHASLHSLGILTLSSKEMRNLVLMYVYSKEGYKRVVPSITTAADAEEFNSQEFKEESKQCQKHYSQLGIMLKRSTCLFSTRERLSQVGKILDQLRDSHVKICTELGSDLAYSCYGIFLHAFIAGWEDDEKVKAFQAIKGASLLEERIGHVMKSKPASLSGYERYVRVFCKEIFLNKSTLADKSFWLAQILKPYPIYFQARLMFILFGPTEPDGENILWAQMAMTSTSISQDLMELSNAFQIFQSDVRGLWSSDDIISLFDEITVISTEWDIENVAIFLKLCGDSMCCEVLGNKAINGRLSELSYIMYYMWQYCSRSNLTAVQLKKEQEWYVALMQHLGKLLPRCKDHRDFVQQIFTIWEDYMMETLEDHGDNDSQVSLQDDERIRFKESLQSLTSLTTTLLTREMRFK
ncbi:F-box only protein 47 isoform X1 [Hydra vulgaris]|nr:F-box only protein 47-like isoform X1 [Hydra vulgaris]